MLTVFQNFSTKMTLELAHENIWFDKWRVDDAERQFYENKSLVSDSSVS